ESVLAMRRWRGRKAPGHWQHTPAQLRGRHPMPEKRLARILGVHHNRVGEFVLAKCAPIQSGTQPAVFDWIGVDSDSMLTSDVVKVRCGRFDDYLLHADGPGAAQAVETRSAESVEGIGLSQSMGDRAIKPL